MLTESVTPIVSHCVGKTLDAGRLELVEVIGEGTSGVVYRAVEQRGDATSSTASSPGEYAVKAVKKAPYSSLEAKHLRRELRAHKAMSSHPSVLTLHKTLEDEDNVYLVLDYCPGGDMFGAVVERHDFTGDDARIKSVFVQLLDAVKSCHERGIFHRDLKPENVLLSADGTQVFLGDFGLVTDEARSTLHRIGSPRYMSPEYIGEEHGFAAYSPETADIWALGVILTEMITGRTPWRRAMTSDPSYQRYLSAKSEHTLCEWLPLSRDAAALLSRVFTGATSERISLVELRAAVLAMPTFFGEVTPAPVVATVAAVAKIWLPGSPKTPVFDTPEFDKGAFDGPYNYPDDEYLFGSPDPDAWPLDLDPPAALLTSATVYSATSTLCDEGAEPFFASVGKDKGSAKEVEPVQEVVWREREDSIAAEKRAALPTAAGRFLARMLA